MIGAMAHEKAPRVRQRFHGLWHVGILAEIEFIRDFEAQQRVVKFQALGNLHRVKTKMTEPPHLKRAWQQNPAYIILLYCNGHVFALLLKKTRCGFYMLVSKHNLLGHVKSESHEVRAPGLYVVCFLWTRGVECALVPHIIC